VIITVAVESNLNDLNPKLDELGGKGSGPFPQMKTWSRIFDFSICSI